jgi:hypothetical protein
MDFRRIVREKAHATNTEVLKHVACDVVLSSVIWKAQEPIGIDGVVTSGLQRIGPDLICEADAATFLPQVKNRAKTRGSDGTHRRVELLFAVTLERPEDFTRDAFGVKADEDVFAAADVTANECDVLLGKAPFVRRAFLGSALEHVRVKLSVTRRNRSFGQALCGRGLRPDHPLGDVHLNDFP